MMSRHIQYIHEQAPPGTERGSYSSVLGPHGTQKVTLGARVGQQLHYFFYHETLRHCPRLCSCHRLSRYLVSECV